MNITALDNAKLNTVVTKTTEICYEVLNFNTDTLTGVRPFWFVFFPPALNFFQFSKSQDDGETSQMTHEFTLKPASFFCGLKRDTS